MPAQLKNRKCSIEGCGRKHAAHDLCLMHYKRQLRHGSAEYRWGGKVVGRPCMYCDRPVIALEMCWRHYQMNRKHGDALYSDKRKVDGLPNGIHRRRGYLMVCPVAEITKAQPDTSPSLTKKDRLHERANSTNHGLRDGSLRSRRQWKHRKVAGAKKGEVVHHIDLNPTNNDPDNLHVTSPAGHAAAHRSLERIAAQLVHLGLVCFDRSAGLYELAEFAVPAKPSRVQP